jgi:DNA replication protein DnaC
MLMKAALHTSVLDSKGGLYLTAATFDRRIKEFGRDPDVQTPDEYVERLADSPSPLLIDDIGAGYFDKSGYTMTRFERLVDMRYGTRGRTAIATNLSAGELRDHLGARVFSRLSDQAVCQLVPMDKCGDVRPLR